MRTVAQSSEFYTSLSQYVFITPDVDINPETNLPYNKNDYAVIDMDWCQVCGCPPINDEGIDMELWAVLDPNENLLRTGAGNARATNK